MRPLPFLAVSLTLAAALVAWGERAGVFLHDLTIALKERPRG
ncbi:hypothetical protein GCM10009737_08460 [Nocardioides lentus]|uniref:Uncharacterized protein n=1 Tax=Nocardioides lentus TaxID=338077 RepID=A0ABP5ABL7_9ACTN